MGQSNSPSENYLFLNVMVNFVIVNQKLTGSSLHIEKNQTIPTYKNWPYPKNFMAMLGNFFFFFFIKKTKIKDSVSGKYLNQNFQI